MAEPMGRKESKELAKRYAPTGVALLIGAGLDFSPLESSVLALACYLLAGIWLLWLYAEPRVIPALASRVNEHLPLEEARSQERQAVVGLLPQIAEELEAALDVLNGHDAEKFFVNHELSVRRWQEYGQRVADAGLTDLHKKVRAAYRAIDALNNRGVKRGVTTRSGDTTILDHTRVQEVKRTVPEALEALEMSQQAQAGAN